SLLSLTFDGLNTQQRELGDNHGKVVRAIADTLTRNVRACDIVGRTGAEDFTIFLSRCAQPNAAMKAEILSRKIHDALDPMLRGKAAVILRYAVTVVEKA